MDISNILDREFKVVVIKILTGLEKRVEDLSETLNKEIENIKTNQSEMKISINEIKNTLERINRLEEAEEWISKLEGRVMESNQAKHENRLRELNNIIKHNNIRIIGIPEGKERKGGENVFEQMIAENFPNLGKETEIQI